jgi:hypothetical protein
MSTWKITFGPVWSRDTLGNVKRSSGMSFDFVSRSGGGAWWLDLVCELRASYLEVVRGSQAWRLSEVVKHHRFGKLIKGSSIGLEHFREAVAGFCTAF